MSGWLIGLWFMVDDEWETSVFINHQSLRFQQVSSQYNQKEANKRGKGEKERGKKSKQSMKIPKQPRQTLLLTMGGGIKPPG